LQENLVVIPTYNERGNIERLLEEVLSLPVEFDVLVVDDSSPDGTWKVVEKIVEREKRVNLIIRAGKQGLGKAYQEGFSWGIKEGYRFIFEMDADFSHAPEDLVRLREAAELFPVVIGSRYVEGGRVEGWSKKREVLSRLGNLYVKILLKIYQQEMLREVFAVTSGRFWKKYRWRNFPGKVFLFK